MSKLEVKGDISSLGIKNFFLRANNSNQLFKKEIEYSIMGNPK